MENSSCQLGDGERTLPDGRVREGGQRVADAQDQKSFTRFCRKGTKEKSSVGYKYNGKLINIILDKLLSPLHRSLHRNRRPLARKAQEERTA